MTDIKIIVIIIIIVIIVAAVHYIHGIIINPLLADFRDMNLKTTDDMFTVYLFNMYMSAK